MRRLLFISLLLLPLTIPEAWADVVVIVRREAEASGNYVRICDVARVEGPREQANEVARTVIGPTPPKGKTREITRWDIESRLYEMGVMARVTFSGNDMVRVYGNGVARPNHDAFEGVELRSLNPFPGGGGSALAVNLGGAGGGTESAAPASPVFKPGPAEPSRASERASRMGLDSMPDDARKRVGQAVSHYLAGRYKRDDVEVESTLLAISESVPYSAYEVKVVEAMGGKVPGKASLRLEVRESVDSEPRKVEVTADTEVFALAPVASKALFKGDVLNAKDALVARVKMESGKSYLPPNAKSVEGRELKRNLKMGEPLLADEAVPTEAVKRGDIVKSITANGAWEIQTNARALGNGMVGETIKVEDLSTKKKYDARITGRGTVSAIVGDWRTSK